jgi:outer membrane protein assembly factor BamB
MCALHRIAAGAALLVVCVASPGPLPAAEWPGFRGPGGNGYCEEKGLPLAWNEKTGENVAWKARLPGACYSSPIVWGDRLFLTLAPPAVKGSKAPAQQVLCLDVKTGRQLWQCPVPAGPEKVEPGYPAATPTPVTDGRLVYAWFGSGVMAAIGFEGQPVWRREFPGPYVLNPALASSPVLFGDTVILLCDQGRKLGFICGIDKQGGQVKWRQDRPDQDINNATPVLAEIGGKPQLIVNGAKRLQGLDPRDGKPIWWCDGRVGFAASPATGEGRVYVDSGAEGGVPGLCVDPGGAGDVGKTHLKWKADRVKAFYGSPVIAGGCVYRTYKPGILECRSLETGEVAYTERLEKLSFLSSPIATADGRVYIASGARSYVVKAGPKFELLGTAALEGGDIGPSPAISGGRIFLCSDSNLYCIADTRSAARGRGADYAALPAETFPHSGQRPGVARRS